MNRQFTILDIIQLSYKYYKLQSGDDKFKRAKLDVVNGRITKQHRFKYNRSTKQWEQQGQNVKIEFRIKTSPISYDRIDTLKYHYYPITFIIDDITKGIHSTFKWRTGSLKKPEFYKKKNYNALAKKQLEKQKKQKKTTKYLLKTPAQIIAEKNIKKGIQLQFFYELEWVLKNNNLLYGRCWATYPPIKTNPKHYIFFDKHAWYIVSKILIPLFKKFKILSHNQRNRKFLQQS